MSITTIQKLTTNITFYVPYVILVIGNIGCICNFITFSAKRLRRNSCGWYFLMSAIFDFLFINFGLFTKLAVEQYGSTLQNTNLTWCRIRTYFTWLFPCIATGYLVLASFDRCLSTSSNPRFRSFSQIKIAHQLTCIPIILYSLTTSHQFIYYVLQPNCVASPGAYSYFLSIYSIVWTSLIPQSAILIFGLITYFNMRKRCRQFSLSMSQTASQRRNRTDLNMITITLVQVLCSSILLNIRTIYYSYNRITANIKKDDYRQAIESLLLQISVYIFFLNFSKNFFLNTLSSKLFRKVFKLRLIILYRRITCCKVRVQPSTISRSSQPEEITTIFSESNGISTVSQ